MTSGERGGCRPHRNSFPFSCLLYPSHISRKYFPAKQWLQLIWILSWESQTKNENDEWLLMQCRKNAVIRISMWWNTLHAEHTSIQNKKAETRVPQSSQCVWPNGRCARDHKGADETKPTLTSKTGRSFLLKETEVFLSKSQSKVRGEIIEEKDVE